MEIKVILTMHVPTFDRREAENKALSALIDSGATSITTPFGATILNAEILDESSP